MPAFAIGGVLPVHLHPSSGAFILHSNQMILLLLLDTVKCRNAQ
jgi:hypothetical protein